MVYHTRRRLSKSNEDFKEFAGERSDKNVRTTEEYALICGKLDIIIGSKLFSDEVSCTDSILVIRSV